MKKRTVFTPSGNNVSNYRNYPFLSLNIFNFTDKSRKRDQRSI